VAWCSLLSAYEKGRQWKKVLYTIDKLEQQGHKIDVVAWSTAISALAKSGHWELAEEKFEKMQQVGCQPNVVTYASLMRAYGNAGLWEKSEALFALMLQKGIRYLFLPVKLDAIHVLWKVTLTPKSLRGPFHGTCTKRVFELHISIYS
jgi:pentatricopeptide repeat protein